MTLVVAAILFFALRVKQLPPPDSAQVASVVAVLHERAEGVRGDLDRVAAKLIAINRTNEATQLRVLKARFLVLHWRHITAIRGNKAELSHEDVGLIYDTVFEMRRVVDDACGATARQWYASLGRIYAHAPEPGDDPAYAAVRREVLSLREATSGRTDAILYPGVPPGSTSKQLCDLAFLPPPPPKAAATSKLAQ